MIWSDKYTFRIFQHPISSFGNTPITLLSVFKILNRNVHSPTVPLKLLFESM